MNCPYCNVSGGLPFWACDHTKKFHIVVFRCGKCLENIKLGIGGDTVHFMIKTTDAITTNDLLFLPPLEHMEVATNWVIPEPREPQPELPQPPQPSARLREIRASEHGFFDNALEPEPWEAHEPPQLGLPEGLRHTTVGLGVVVEESVVPEFQDSEQCDEVIWEFIEALNNGTSS